MKKELKESRAVPFQLCPKCKGDGTVARNFIGKKGVSYSVEICDVCEGSKVIPMCVL